MKFAIKLGLAATGALMMLAPMQASAQTGNSMPRQADASRRGTEIQREGEVTFDPLARKMVLSKDEQRAIKKIEAALAAKNYAAAGAALTAAGTVAKSNDAKYMVAALQLRLGTETNDVARQDLAIDAAIATGVAPAALLPELYRRQSVAAILAKDYVKAEGALGSLLALTPHDADSVVLLAETKNRAGKPAEALPLLERAIALKAAAGQPVPAEWNRAVGIMKAKMQVKR